jgi:hypothetical protein
MRMAARAQQNDNLADQACAGCPPSPIQGDHPPLGQHERCSAALIAEWFKPAETVVYRERIVTGSSALCEFKSITTKVQVEVGSRVLLHRHGEAVAA